MNGTLLDIYLFIYLFLFAPRGGPTEALDEAQAMGPEAKVLLCRILAAGACPRIGLDVLSPRP